MPLLKKISDISSEDISLIKSFLSDRQPFSIYFNAALNELKKGVHNRRIWFRKDKGCVMGIDFDSISIYTLIGEIDSDVIGDLFLNPGRIEIHAEARHVASVNEIFGPRFVRRSGLKYYQLRRTVPFDLDRKEIRRLGAIELNMLQEFYREYYNGTIFSEWMLENPFMGLFVEGDLVAAGGAIAIDKASASANIGNFLTKNNCRGRGFCQILAKSLVNELIKEGIYIFTLGTTEENIAAWKAYETLGFQLIEVREELEMAALKAPRDE